MGNYIAIGICWFLVVFLLGNIVCYLLYLILLSKITDLSELKVFEKKLRNKKILHILFFSIQLIFQEIEKLRDFFYSQTGVDLEAIAQEVEQSDIDQINMEEEEDDDEEYA